MQGSIIIVRRLKKYFFELLVYIKYNGDTKNWKYLGIMK